MSKAELSDYQDSFDSAQKKLFDAGIDTQIDYKDQQIKKVIFKPFDLSRNAEARINALKDYQNFVQKMLKDFSNKEILEQKKFKSVISKNEKLALQQSATEATKLISHFQEVIILRELENFLHNDEYLLIAGDILEKTKKAVADMNLKYGVYFTPTLVENNILFRQPPEMYFSHRSNVPAFKKALFSHLKGLLQKPSGEGDVYSVVEQLSGKLVVADIGEFHEYKKSQLSDVESLVALTKNSLQKISDYQGELDSIEDQLKDETGFKVKSQSDLEEYEGIRFEGSKFSSRYNEMEQKVSALKNYKKNIREFLNLKKKQKISLMTDGEVQRLESGTEEANKWIEFYKKMSEMAKSPRLVYFPYYVENWMTPLEKREKELKKSAKKVGVDIDNLPLSKVDGQMAWLYNQPLRKLKIRLSQEDSFSLDKQIEVIYDLLRYLGEVNVTLTEIKDQQIEVTPHEKVLHTETHLRRSLQAIEYVEDFIKGFTRR